MKFLMCIISFRQINTMQINKISKKFGYVENKILDVSGLVIKTVLNARIHEVENKILDVRGLVKKTL